MPGLSDWSRQLQQRMSRRAALQAGGITGAGIVFAACSSSNTNGNTSKPAATQAATQPAVASTAATKTATPAGPGASGSPAAGAVPSAPPGAGNFKSGGTIQSIFVVASVPLDPFQNVTYTTQEISAHSYSRLMRFYTSNNQDVTLQRYTVPDAAGSYEQPDKTTYVFRLRPEAVFHPPLSRPITSADVLSSYQRFTTEDKNTNKGVFDGFLDTVTSPDAQTSQFKLKEPYVPFLNKLANSYLWLLPQEANTGKLDPSQQMIGTGPWVYAGQTPTVISYKKNPSYFIKGIPYADGLQLNIIPQTATQEAQFQAGALDLLGVPTTDVPSMQKAVPKATVLQITAGGLDFAYFADVQQDPVFKDVRMRQAASLAMDRDALIDLIYAKQGVWGNLIPPNFGRYFLDPKSSAAGASAQYFKHDPQAAKQLIAAAGQDNTQIKYYYSNNAYGDTFNQWADAYRGMLSDAGFKLTVVTVDYLKDYITPTGIYGAGPPPSSMAFGPQAGFTDPDDYFSLMLSSNGGRNNSRVRDPQLDAMIQAQQVEFDDARRTQLVLQIQEYQGERMYYVPSIAGTGFTFLQPWLQGYVYSTGYAFGTEATAYFSVNNK